MGGSAALQPNFQQVFEALPGGYLVVLPDAPRYSIVAVSDAFAHAMSATREEVLGRGLFEVLEDGRGHEEAASLEQVVRTKSTRVSVRRDPGSLESGRLEACWWRSLSAPVLDANGDVAYIIHHIDNVSEVIRDCGQELDQANRELRQANEHINRLFDLAAEGILIADLSGRLLSVNGAVCRMLGYSHDELIGKNLVDILSREEIPRMWQQRERLLQGHVETLEWTTVRKDGRRVPTEVTAKILPDGRWQAFLRDISERKLLETALEWSHEDLERAQSVAKIGSWRLDVRLEMLKWSDETYRIFGVARGTPMSYAAFIACVHPDDRDYVHREWNAALRGAPYDIEHRLLVGGEVKWVREKADLEFDAGGRLLGGIGITQDITERKRLESTLKALNADLNRAQSVAKVGSWRLDMDRNVLDWTDESYRIFGVSPGTPMTYDRFLACVHPDDRAHVDRAWAAARRGVPYDIEHRIVAAGETRWVREKADLEFDARGVLVGGVGTAQDITQRKRHEEEQLRAQVRVRESEERFDLALRGAGLALWDWNVGTGEFVFGERWLEMRGLMLEDVKPHVESWTAGIHPDDWPYVQSVLDNHFKGLTAEYRAEYRVRTPSGQWIWIAGLGRVFSRDSRSRPIRMVGVELDITERKRLEADLRIAEAKSSGILSISPDAIISIDEQQRITMFNEGAENIFGYTRSEAIGAPLSILLPERLRAIHERHVDRFMQSRETSRQMGERTMNIVGRRKTGEEFPADAAISKLEISGRRILTVALRDITIQKRLESELQLLAETGSVLATTLDYDETLSNIARLAVRDVADVCVVDVSEADIRRVEIITNDPEKEPICESLKRFGADRYRSELLRTVFEGKQSLVVNRITPELVDSIAHNDEHRRLLSALSPQAAVAVPLIVRGRPIGAMAFVSTTARTYGPSDVRLMEELARRAALAIENARLYLAAVSALRARDEVLGIVAHDLRNPLGTILMQATRLQRSRPDADATGAAGDCIHRAATRMNHLIQDLLDVARIEAGHLTIDRRSTPTRPVVLEAIEGQRSRAAAAGVRLVPLIGDALPDVFADRERLLQVFENLVGNALKFTRSGGTITISAKSRGAYVVFSVADTGAGISSEQLPHVFDRFWQARSTGRGGAGLGLAIVKGIVEEHGGRLWVESTEGRGSTFSFMIPASRGKPARPSLHEERESRPSAPA